MFRATTKPVKTSIQSMKFRQIHSVTDIKKLAERKQLEELNRKRSLEICELNRKLSIEIRKEVENHSYLVDHLSNHEIRKVSKIRLFNKLSRRRNEIEKEGEELKKKLDALTPEIVDNNTSVTYDSVCKIQEIRTILEEHPPIN